ncbi:MAG: endolytic transglycosylase MltG [Gammaproteobacteria bacterium]
MRKLIYFLLGTCVLLGVAGAGFAWQVQHFLQTPVSVGQDGILYEIPPGSTINQVAQQLHQQNIISHPRLFVWLAELTDKDEAIKAGEYEILPGTLPEQLLEQFASGKVKQHDLRIGEGWTIHDVLAAVSAHPKLKHTLKSYKPEYVARQLGVRTPHPEGWFFPDTYHFPKGTTDVAFLQRAHTKMQVELAREWAGRAPNLPYKSPYEALIMASIIEKETGLSVEHREVGGVYVRRLKINMRLQADPTVIYGLGDAYEKPLTRTNLKTHTPYNTYMVKGLPPTPIAMPGLEALNAAMHPAPGDALYFVATGDGGHSFSSSLEEHNRAVARYREWQRLNPETEVR